MDIKITKTDSKDILAIHKTLEKFSDKELNEVKFLILGYELGQNSKKLSMVSGM